MKMFNECSQQMTFLVIQLHVTIYWEMIFTHD